MNSTAKMKSVVAGCLLWNVSACASTETIRWKEEIALHDGKAIVVERSVTLGGNVSREIGQGPGESNYTLSFTAPDGKEIAWENPGQLTLMVLGFENGIPYLATQPRMIVDYARYKCPEPAYVFYKYSDGWKQIRYEEFPQTIKNSNFLISSKGDKLRAEGYISAEKIKALNESLDRDYRQIDPNNHSPSGCEKTRFLD